MIPVGPSRPSYWRALFVAVISGFFVVLSIHSMCRGNFRTRGHAADVTSVSDPVLFWGFLGFMLLAGAVGLYAAFRDVRFLVRRRRRKS